MYTKKTTTKTIFLKQVTIKITKCAENLGPK